MCVTCCELVLLAAHISVQYKIGCVCLNKANKNYNIYRGKFIIYIHCLFLENKHIRSKIEKSLYYILLSRFFRQISKKIPKIDLWWIFFKLHNFSIKDEKQIFVEHDKILSWTVSHDLKMSKIFHVDHFDILHISLSRMFSFYYVVSNFVKGCLFLYKSFAHSFLDANVLFS